MLGCGNTMLDLSDLSHFTEDKYAISIFLSWYKDFIALAGKNIQIIIYIFLISRRKLGSSNEYKQHMFSWETKKCQFSGK